MKVYSVNNKITVICPICNSSYIFDSSGRINKCKFTCKKCKTTHLCEVCYRSTFRKECDLFSTIMFNDLIYNCTILDMSLCGYRFKLSKLPLIPLTIGDHAKLIFMLPNKQQFEVNDIIEIVYSSGLIFGAKVILNNTYSPQQRNKGFWLQDGGR